MCYLKLQRTRVSGKTPEPAWRPGQVGEEAQDCPKLLHVKLNHTVSHKQPPCCLTCPILPPPSSPPFLPFFPSEPRLLFAHSQDSGTFPTIPFPFLGLRACRRCAGSTSIPGAPWVSIGCEGPGAPVGEHRMLRGRWGRGSRGKAREGEMDH